MQITLTELIGFLGIVLSIITWVWIFVSRVGRLEEKIDNVLACIKHKKKVASK